MNCWTTLLLQAGWRGPDSWTSQRYRRTEHNW